MCCNLNHENNCKCSCQKVSNSPELWSKKKKIRILENHLAHLESEANEIKEALNELNELKE